MRPCPKCGAMLSDPLPALCPNCGTALGPGLVQQAPPPKSYGRNLLSAILIVFGVIITVVVLLILGLLLLCGGIGH